MATILVVDSGNSLLSLLMTCLESSGHVILLAHDGNEAARVAKEKGLDLLICGSGELKYCDVIREVREHCPWVKTILVSEGGGIITCSVDTVLHHPSPKRFQKVLKDSLPPPP